MAAHVLCFSEEANFQISYIGFLKCCNICKGTCNV